MITGNWDVDFVSVVPFEVNDEKLSVMNMCDFPCKIFKQMQKCVVCMLSSNLNLACERTSQC